MPRHHKKDDNVWQVQRVASSSSLLVVVEEQCPCPDPATPKLEEDIKRLLDNFGQTRSEPAVSRTGKATGPEGSVLEVSLKQITYTESHSKVPLIKEHEENEEEADEVSIRELHSKESSRSKSTDDGRIIMLDEECPCCGGCECDKNTRRLTVPQEVLCECDKNTRRLTVPQEVLCECDKSTQRLTVPQEVLCECDKNTRRLTVPEEVLCECDKNTRRLTVSQEVLCECDKSTQRLTVPQGVLCECECSNRNTPRIGSTRTMDLPEPSKSCVTCQGECCCGGMVEETDHEGYPCQPSEETDLDIPSLHQDLGRVHRVTFESPKIKGKHLTKDFCCILPAVEDNQVQGNERRRTNRYNYNHIQVCREPKIKRETFFTRLFGRGSNRRPYDFRKVQCGASESGETIPQLYKANVKRTTDATPERFTFRAVTGAAPVKTVRCECQLKLYSKSNKTIKPHICKEKCALHFADGLDYQSGKEKKKKKKWKSSCLSRRACMNLNGNEYISTQSLPERIDIYCFDHLNTSYFRTTDDPPSLLTDIAIERTEAIATRFWAELFGLIHIFIAFIIAFILQLYKFILYSMIRPLMIGLAQLTADYFVKPLLTIVYNGFIQPALVFLFNIAASLRDLCSPIATGIGYFVRELAILLRSLRLIEYNKTQIVKKDAAC